MAFPDKIKGVIPTDEMFLDDPEERELLKRMLEVAIRYLSSFKWCLGIKESYLGGGVGKVIAAFLFQIDHPPDVDDWLWIIVGDVPPAYLVLDNTDNAADALSEYCLLMDDWIDAARNGKDLDKVFPVRADATEEHAAMLESRLEFIREKIIPHFLKTPKLQHNE